MNGSDNLLTEGLKYLAAAAPEEAPPRIAANLEFAFRHHHLRQKRIRIAQFATIAASLFFALLWMHWRGLPQAGEQHSTQAKETPQPAAHDSIASASPAPVQALPRTVPSHQSAASLHRHSALGDNRQSASGKFMFIPGMAPETSTGSLMVVRLELPTSALSLVGLSAAGDSSQDRVLVDILMDQDGTPYSIRIPNESQ
jgi:hypothetical protein